MLRLWWLQPKFQHQKRQGKRVFVLQVYKHVGMTYLCDRQRRQFRCIGACVSCAPVALPRSPCIRDAAKKRLQSGEGWRASAAWCSWIWYCAGGIMALQTTTGHEHSSHVVHRTVSYRYKKPSTLDAMQECLHHSSPATGQHGG